MAEYGMIMKETVSEKVCRTLRETLDVTKKYVAAVSGGADSLALADALQCCGFSFTVCHVEHGIRGSESLEDAAYVKEFCRKRGMIFCCRHVDAQELRKNEKLSLEDAARRLRYQALIQCAEETGADFILTAHQKDDQAETFLLRLLRGSGTRGLGAIRFRCNRVLRPFLTLSAVELRKYCRDREIVWREDATNEDLHYMRNRIRKVLFPLLKSDFSPAVTDILCRTAEHLQTDGEYLEKLAEAELKKRWVFPAETQNGVLLADSWEDIPAALRFRVLRRFWHLSGATGELSGVNLEDLEQLLINHDSGKKILLPGSWQALYSYGKLILFSEGKLKALQEDTAWSYSVNLECNFASLSDSRKGILEFFFPDNRVAQISFEKEKPAYQYRKQMIYPLCRLKRLGNSLVFRYRQAGDRIFPLKGTGHKTLKKYLIERKVPVEVRDRLVVAAAGNEIVWIPGIANARWEEEKSSMEVPARDEGWLFINIK
ncbi:MAG TPA: tRNA lysidine(34) synthetase TilS [Acidaminococcaceae bacterium]|nr:tRNA lysidine(34) synthetase TilS [Acidaminococcaceae bacterium]